jgi:hypothetical protein
MNKIISEHRLKGITGLSGKERKNVFSWLSNQPEQNVIDIFQQAVKGSFAMKNARPDLPGKVVKYCSFILAARHNGWNTYRGKGYRVADRKQISDFSAIRKAKAAELIKRGRRPMLRKKILAYWGEVKELREEGHSFRAVAEFLTKKRKLKVSSSYISRMWKEVEND